MELIASRERQLRSGDVWLRRSRLAGVGDDEGESTDSAIAWLLGLDDVDDIPAAYDLTQFVAWLADSWDDAQRQKLIPYLPRVAKAGMDDYVTSHNRKALSVRWLQDVWAPAWYDLAGLADHRRSLHRFNQNAQQILDSARLRVAAAEERVAATTADFAGAHRAGQDAKDDMFRTSGWQALGQISDRAWMSTARHITGELALAVAWEAAAMPKARRAWHIDTARDAAQESLRPTVLKLQAGLLDLLDQVIDPNSRH